MEITIRRELPTDAPQIHAVTKAAFLDAPHTAHTEHFIVDALRRAGALTISLVAEGAGVIVGHVAISPVVISDGARGWYGLGPLSVAPQYQRQGIGSKLVVAALARLRETGASGCALVGDPAYYGRFGFKAEQSLVYPEIPPEYFQVLAFAPRLPQGVVTFHAAFGVQE